MATPTTYKLIYFDAPGRGEVIRMLFHLAGVRFEDCRVTDEEWVKLKPGMPFNQLPVLEINGGERVLCQSYAISRYLANEFGLAGNNAWEAALCDSYVDALVDVLGPFVFYKYVGQSDAEREVARVRLLVDTLPSFCVRVDEAIRRNPAGLLVSDKLTWADVSLAYVITIMETDKIDFRQYPNIMRVVERVCGHPNLADFLDEQDRKCTALGL